MSYMLQKNVRGDLEDDNSHEHELVSRIHSTLSNMNVLCKSTSQRTGNVHPV